MAKKPRIKKHKQKPGLAPGTIVYTGQKSSQSLYIEIFNYSANHITEKELTSIDEALTYKSESSNEVTWININGLNHTDAIEKVGNHYNIHALILEDIANISQRPKIDEFENYLAISMKMLYYDASNGLTSEQVSFILGHNYVLTFQEAEGDVFDGLRERLRHGKGRIKSLGSDYLLYALIDSVVDHYYIVIESIGEKIEDLEDDLFNGSAKEQVTNQIQDLKREILRIRRAVFPLRDIINRIEKSEHKLISERTIPYFQDVYDHTVQVNENIEIYREMVWGLMDMYMTSISNKMNEVMKVLTIMSSIFIPLTFIAGIYGMNFENMPELHHKNGYPILLVVMLFMFILMLIYFKRKKWL
ncbi:magnesium and cobalt transport protein CorA [Formosa agariphila KMM 3901]|uniref:Magnesium transport protein CorA n=1 Tax=Formosa agariphila (strain DSM 15362 / KCTC 12365 / LMG 23005 / KMM 3901 / M-2Alg 35-1) TaxID=1347342 RepID=T2KKN7_FORAG|nr:magnesium/cobalt transporter CorA [Formosa agariphila]CDF79008.1 magnesium and cobalt transport protein CorA [Formosa agariphila KMM 3901]